VSTTVINKFGYVMGYYGVHWPHPKQMTKELVRVAKLLQI